MTLNSVCTVTNGSSQVTRVSGDIWDNVQPGGLFVVTSDGVPYWVASVVPATDGTLVTTIYLSSYWLGASTLNANCTISESFTPNKNLPLINDGDIENAEIFNRAAEILDDEDLDNVPNHGPSHRPDGPDPIPLADTEDGGLMNQLDGKATSLMTGENSLRDISGIRNSLINILGNPNFEVAQRNCGALVTLGGTQLVEDRWNATKAGATMQWSAQRVSSYALPGVQYPGTGWPISNSFMRLAVTTSQATLATGDLVQMWQYVEGGKLRIISGYPMSALLVVRANVAPIKFALRISDSPTSRSFSHLCTIPVANVWTAIKIENITQMPAGGWTSQSGVTGMVFAICLAAGATYVPVTNDVWNPGTYGGAFGMDNFASRAAGSYFDIAYASLQPSNICSIPVEVPFSENLHDCMRYYQKSYNYGVAPGAVTQSGCEMFYAAAGQHPMIPIRFNRAMITPTNVSGYSINGGAGGNVRDVAANIDRAISAVVGVGQGGFSGFQVTTPNASAAQYGFQWTADTGI